APLHGEESAPAGRPLDGDAVGSRHGAARAGMCSTYDFSSTGRYAMWSAAAGLVVADANATHQVVLNDGSSARPTGRACAASRATTRERRGTLWSTHGQWLT